LRDPNLLGLNPSELEAYTPRELDALLNYAESKRDALRNA
jgi:hypothetical protein